MKILGINISHDASVAGIVDGEVQFVYDEARFRRNKYWSPNYEGEESCMYDCIEHELCTNDWDAIIFASFDRRGMSFGIDKDKLVWNRMNARDFLADVSAEPLTTTRVQQLQEKYTKNNFSWSQSNLTDDKAVITDIMTHQFTGRGGEEFFNRDYHHLYHAYCGYKLSPFFRKGEDAMCIVQDGGGGQPFYDEYPGFQEIESIYTCTPTDLAKLQWQRLSNHRLISDLSNLFPNELDDCTHCIEDFHKKLVDNATGDDADFVFTSEPSNGMNFSNLSAALGTDEEGRAAGKVMGMASYGRVRPNVFNRYTVAQQCELDSYDSTCNMIDNAIKRNPDCKNIVLSGGYSLNCTNNYKYLEAYPDYQFFVDPIPHDGGTAVGAGLWLDEKAQKGIITIEEQIEGDNDED
jgi:predicted NodU family carbamoyl transferase